MKTDLFVMSGQSNMQGQSECFEEFYAPDKVCREYAYLTNEFRRVKNPSGEDIQVNGEYLLLMAHQGFSSLVPYFADEYYKLTGRDATYVHAAKGATIVKQWLPGTNRYDMLIKKVNACKELCKKQGLELASENFVWLQGESDAIEDNSRKNYKDELVRFWESVKKDTGLKNFLMIRVGYFYHFPCERIMLAQEELCRERDDFYMVSDVTADFTIENGLMQTDATAGFHYTNRGYEAVGRDSARGSAKVILG